MSEEPNKMVQLRDVYNIWLTEYYLPLRLEGLKPPKQLELDQIIIFMESNTISWAKNWIEEGMRKGLEKGIEKGMQQGRSEGLKIGRREEALSILTRLLVRRFGFVPVDMRDRLSEITHDEIEQCIDVAVEAKSIDEVWNLIRNH